LIIHDNVSALISPHRILDVLKEIKNLKIGQKWTIIVMPKAEGMEDSPAKLEFRIGLTSPIGLCQINWNGFCRVIW
jgi:hypothetical protein